MLFYLIICLLILYILLVLLLRNLSKQRWVAKFDKKWTTWAEKRRKIPTWQHVGVVFVGLYVSTVCYLQLIKLYKPQFSMPKTDAINWFTVHNYPRQQDMFYFITAFSFIFILTSILWFLWMLQKNK